MNSHDWDRIARNHDGEELGQWRHTWEYPGCNTWSRAINGPGDLAAVVATPYHEDAQMIPVDYMFDGEGDLLPVYHVDIPQSLTWEQYLSIMQGVLKIAEVQHGIS